MGKQVGVWVDHQKALIAILANEEETIRLITTKGDQQLRSSGNSPSDDCNEEQLAPANKPQQRIFIGKLPFYYDAVVAYMQDAESIVIFGPSHATDELRARLEKNNLSGRITRIAPVDEMTSHQIVEEVRKQIIK
ncbi:MAG: hypothetical protein JXA21_11925 [Anaerolineae bacterium]|nr:hypothetical protein [Anaerolineae bacterium]